MLQALFGEENQLQAKLRINFNIGMEISIIEKFIWEAANDFN